MTVRFAESAKIHEYLGAGAANNTALKTILQFADSKDGVESAASRPPS
jgi:hypothetical protein